MAVEALSLKVVRLVSAVPLPKLFPDPPSSLASVTTVPSGEINCSVKSLSLLCVMYRLQVTLLIGVEMPETVIGELMAPRSGIACIVLLSKRTAVPGLVALRRCRGRLKLRFPAAFHLQR